MPELTSIGVSSDILRWAQAAHRRAVDVLDTAPQDAFECEGTWFVGVDALPNATDGSLDGVPFPCSVRSEIEAQYGPLGDVHPAQLSTVYRGYPKPRANESPSAFAYRLDRDGAHVDGLLPLGPNRRRHIIEPHRYILGIPLTPVMAEQAPMIYYRGSADIMRQAFASALEHISRGEDVANVDVTDAYHGARRTVFETCPRICVTAQVGSAYILDPLSLHGIAPFSSPDAGGRIIAYIRPQLAAADSLNWCAART